MKKWSKFETVQPTYLSEVERPRVGKLWNYQGLSVMVLDVRGVAFKEVAQIDICKLAKSGCQNSCNRPCGFYV